MIYRGNVSVRWAKGVPIVCALVVVIVVLRLAFVSQDPTRFVENARVTSHEEV